MTLKQNRDTIFLLESIKTLHASSLLTKDTATKECNTLEPINAYAKVLAIKVWHDTTSNVTASVYPWVSTCIIAFSSFSSIFPYLGHLRVENVWVFNKYNNLDDLCYNF